MTDACLVDAVRTPIGRGKPGGAVAEVHPVQLHAHVLRRLAERTRLDPAVIDDVIGGAVGQVGPQNGNTTRWAVLAAGLPESVPAVTVDRQCGSSQQALHFAAQGVQGGLRGRDRLRSGVDERGPDRLPDPREGYLRPGVADRYPDGLIPQGISAELIADRWNLTREDLDRFAARSHERAAAAWQAGRFAREVEPVPLAGGRSADRDESIRPGTTTDILAGLRPAFRAEHWETRYPHLQWKTSAGNSSPVNDGAAAVLVASAEAVERYGLTPRARVHTVAVAADDPVYMLTGIMPATAKALNRAGLRIDDIDAFEVNEAFASVVLAWLAETGADPDRVNVNDGATALGHPLGASGARLMTTLLNVLEQTDGRTADHVRSRRHRQRHHHRTPLTPRATRTRRVRTPAPRAGVTTWNACAIIAQVQHQRVSAAAVRSRP